MAEEKLRLIKEQADKYALENQETRGALVDGDKFRAIGEKTVAAMIQTIQAASNLEDEDKEKLCRHLRELGERLARDMEPAETAAAA